MLKFNESREHLYSVELGFEGNSRDSYYRVHDLQVFHWERTMYKGIL